MQGCVAIMCRYSNSSSVWLQVVKEKYIKHVIYEKEVLQSLRSQYVVNLHYCFKVCACI